MGFFFLRLSGSGQWKPASRHLFNKVGRLVNQPSHSFTLSLPTPTARLTAPVAPPDVVYADAARRGATAGGARIDAGLMQQTGGGLVSRRGHLFTHWRAQSNPPQPGCVPDVARIAADAAHADAAVAAPQRRTAQAGGGRGPGRASAEVFGKEQGGGDAMQTEEKSMGDVAGEEGRRAHSDQHAASGTHLSEYSLAACGDDHYRQGQSAAGLPIIKCKI